MFTVAVYCGSRAGHDPRFAQAAQRLGQALGERGFRLVYGGGRSGLMGQVADAALAAGAQVLGVIPRRLMARELGHTGVQELRVVDTMHERKLQMAQAADAFVALPGGLGTLEELFEVWTWAQLGLHAKPCGLLDTDGFFAPLVGFLDHAAIRALHELDDAVVRRHHQRGQPRIGGCRATRGIRTRIHRRGRGRGRTRPRRRIGLGRRGGRRRRIAMISRVPPHSREHGGDGDRGDDDSLVHCAVNTTSSIQAASDPAPPA